MAESHPHIVVDASVALAWCLPDETNAYADAVLLALEKRQVIVPAVWPLEITNAIAMAKRRARIETSDIEIIVRLLGNLTIKEVIMPVTQAIREILVLAQEHDLSAYDAAYLHAALFYAAPLATLDKKMKKAAQQAGVRILNAT